MFQKFTLQYLSSCYNSLVSNLETPNRVLNMNTMTVDVQSMLIFSSIIHLLFVRLYSFSFSAFKIIAVSELKEINHL